MSYWSHWLVLTLIVFLLFFSGRGVVFAQEYVLPYPGFMPGHPLYRISALIDQLEEWWSFGSFAKFSYHLGQADKKLIEAKTLFEYKQYLLAKEALFAYDRHLRTVFLHVGNAKLEGKNISQKGSLLKAAVKKHQEVLEDVKSETPATFIWRPEKGEEEIIEIEKLILETIELGKACSNI